MVFIVGKATVDVLIHASTCLDCSSWLGKKHWLVRYNMAASILSFGDLKVYIQILRHYVIHTLRVGHLVVYFLILRLLISTFIVI